METRVNVNEYLRLLQLCEDQGICGKLKKRVLQDVLATLTTYMEIRLSFHSVGVCCYASEPGLIQKQSLLQKKIITWSIFFSLIIWRLGLAFIQLAIVAMYENQA